MCEAEIWFWEALGAEVGFEGAPKEDGREMKFDSTPLKKDIFLEGPTLRRQSPGKHGLKGSGKMELDVGKMCGEV